MKIAMTSIYVIIFFCGILGNFVFCIVLLRNKVLHTATNIYLFSMSCSDLIVLFFGLPYDFNSLWTDESYFPQKYSVFHSLLLESSTNASIITITIFTIERYIGICHPLRTQTMSLVERVPKIIVGIWLISFLLTIPLITFHPSSYEGEKTYNPYAANAFITLSFVCLFSIPMVLITILYVRIIFELKQSERISNVKSCRGESAIKAGSKSSTEMVAHYFSVAVVASFFLCFSPLQCQRLISVFGDEQREAVFMTMRVLTHLSGIFHYLSTCINPILYHIMSDRFRKAMKVSYSRV
ncbi:UNVERIFIED_CONTAM: hypothetical protein GTU68_049934 [Idotea baltica]|nr:hypothetical protein [Idotea baltica]